MKIETCQFVKASELFKNCDEAWNIFTNAAKDFTWGGANRTLIDTDYVVDLLSTEPENEEVKTVIRNIHELPEDCWYVDLEN